MYDLNRSKAVPRLHTFPFPQQNTMVDSIKCRAEINRNTDVMFFFSLRDIVYILLINDKRASPLDFPLLNPN